MGRRTIAGHKLTFNKRGKPDELICPADLNGKRLQDIFANWSEALKNEGALLAWGQSFLRVQDVKRYSENVVVVDTMSGKAGEEGVVYDSESGKSRFSLTENDVPASSARAILVSPPRGDMALWFSEYSARSSGASLLLELFKKKWNDFGTETTFNKARLIASEIAIQEGIVTEVEVRLTRRSDDRVNGIEMRKGTFSHRFKPSKDNPMSARIIDTFRANPAEAYELLEIETPSPASDSDIYVSVDVDGRSRKIQISNLDDGVYFREELNASGAPILSDDDIVGFCAEEAKTFLERSGLDWEDSWARRR